jgi:hypothetical protein
MALDHTLINRVRQETFGRDSSNLQTPVGIRDERGGTGRRRHWQQASGGAFGVLGSLLSRIRILYCDGKINAASVRPLAERPSMSTSLRLWRGGCAIC